MTQKELETLARHFATLAVEGNKEEKNKKAMVVGFGWGDECKVINFFFALQSPMQLGTFEDYIKSLNK